MLASSLNCFRALKLKIHHADCCWCQRSFSKSQCQWLYTTVVSSCSIYLSWWGSIGLPSSTINMCRYVLLCSSDLEEMCFLVRSKGSHGPLRDKPVANSSSFHRRSLLSDDSVRRFQSTLHWALNVGTPYGFFFVLGWRVPRLVGNQRTHGTCGVMQDVFFLYQKRSSSSLTG